MSLTLKELAALLAGELKGPPDLEIHGIAPIDRATPRDITFIAHRRYAALAETSQAAAFIVSPQWGHLSRPLIVVPHPQLAYAEAAALFAPPLKRFPGVSPQACLGENVEWGEDVSVAPLVFLGDGVKLGDRVTIMPGCVIGDEVQIGDDTLLHPNVTVLARGVLGRRVIVHSGAVIGSDGFGYVPVGEGHRKIPQLGIVVIEDEVEIGANCTIDRAALGETRLGRGTKLDNLVHLAHNVTVGENSLLVAQAGVAGSSQLGKGVVLGGQVGVVGHIALGDGVKVGAQSGVTHNLPAGQVFLGSPAWPYAEALKIYPTIRKLPEIYRRLQQVERQLAALTALLEKEPRK
jgi:UDP-3-O-[3-hydroxymyristoyl] glucosamine N-acyltransferase